MSATYALLRSAIVAKQSVRLTAGGFIRDCSPHCIGTTHWVERVLVFQFGGDSSKGLPRGGAWRCFDVDDVSGVAVLPGEPWRSGDDHTRRQSCVTSVDAEVC